MKINKNTKLETIVKQLIKVSFIDGKLNPKKVKEIVDSLKTLSVGNAIPSLMLYLKGLKRELAKHRLVIETPVVLSSSQIDAIVEVVDRSILVYETEIIVNPTLLAGFRIKIGDEVYEDSVKDRINQLREKIYE